MFELLGPDGISASLNDDRFRPVDCRIDKSFLSLVSIPPDKCFARATECACGDGDKALIETSGG